MAFKQQMLTREQLSSAMSQILAQAEAQDLQAQLNAVGSAAALAAMRAERYRLLSGADEVVNVQSDNPQPVPVGG